MQNIIDLCEERLNAIRRLEKQFEKSPSKGDAIVLRDLWINWRDEWMKEYNEWMKDNKGPLIPIINDKITKYSEYININQ